MGVLIGFLKHIFLHLGQFRVRDILCQCLKAVDSKFLARLALLRIHAKGCLNDEAILISLAKVAY